MNRKKAREYAYQMIFSYLFNSEKDEYLFEKAQLDKELSEGDIEYIDLTFGNAISNLEEIKGIIEKYAIGYQLDRIYKPDLAVLILAIGEMKYNEEVPDGVAISEAVVIIKKYSTAKSGHFVNGLLASVYKELN
ncbi:MAG: transcription antitermination factor NusB [Clostridia bacterium]|nr:transcription antitermination factor NusB [Clostridia bacterium]